ncbi:unnamed protein product [Phaeothamnion confervicola]
MRLYDRLVKDRQILAERHGLLLRHHCCCSRRRSAVVDQPSRVICYSHASAWQQPVTSRGFQSARHGPSRRNDACSSPTFPSLRSPSEPKSVRCFGPSRAGALTS